ncbi:MAG: cupin-like domain-containing protein [Pseudomonadota bacterium]
MTHQIKEIEGINPINVGESFACISEPLVLRGLVKDWPVVEAGRQSPDTAADYIREYYSGDHLTAFTGAPEIRGRVAYNDELTGFNFERISATLDQVLNPIFENLDNPQPPAYYVGSTLLDRWFPGFREHNDLRMGDRDLLVSLWLGNRIKVSAHFDVADNIACCVVGRRKFTLFPPEQLDNLYVGPWDNTPAGQPISLVDFDQPDLDRFPRFRQAMDAAYTATLEPGDGICIPSMWWHHVESLDGFNVLVNYWWRTTPRYMGAPLSVLKHALLSLKGLPPEQRKAWQHIFDFYIFNESDEASAHIPEHSRGILGQMSDATARQLRADLLNQLNR